MDGLRPISQLRAWGSIQFIWFQRLAKEPKPARRHRRNATKFTLVIRKRSAKGHVHATVIPQLMPVQNRASLDFECNGDVTPTMKCRGRSNSSP